MQISTAEAAEIAQVSARTIRRYADHGILSANTFGSTMAVYKRQVHALKNVHVVGAHWKSRVRAAALDLLSGERVTTLEGSELSRLKSRLRSMTVERLAGTLLAGHVSTYSATAAQHRQIGSVLADQLGLAGIGVSVLVAEQSSRAALFAGLVPDGDGDVVAVDGRAEHRAVLEALGLFVYGGRREHSAARTWLENRLSSI